MPPGSRSASAVGGARAGLLDNARGRHLNGADLGAVAQLGERCNRTAEVRSSILLGSTNQISSSRNPRAFVTNRGLAAPVARQPFSALKLCRLQTRVTLP